MARQRVRIRFAKQGDLRLISHRDLMRTWERLFRRANVALAMTEGFHPKPKMMFPSALAVGIAGEDEALEIELAQDHDLDTLAAMLRKAAPPGLVIHGALPVASGAKTRLRSMTFEVAVPAERCDAVTSRIQRFRQQSSYPVMREGRASPVDLRPLVEELDLGDDCTLRIRLSVAADANARPREVLAALGLEDVEAHGIVIRRTAVELIP
jgi:radical SAM-linked protein